jgi:hypothetical protein
LFCCLLLLSLALSSQGRQRPGLALKVWRGKKTTGGTSLRLERS